jgi:hypothetical protein
MNDVSKQSLGVLRQIADFLETLPPDQVDDLAEGRARLAIIPWGSTAPMVTAAPARRPARTAAPTVDAAATAAQVEAAQSREDAKSLLDPLKLADLTAVAAALHIGSPRRTKPALIKQIVELTAGARLTGDALRAL